MKRENEDAPPYAGMKAIGSVVAVGLTMSCCGMEYLLWEYAKTESEGSGLISYVPFIAVGLVGILKIVNIVRNLLSSELRNDIDIDDN